MYVFIERRDGERKTEEHVKKIYFLSHSSLSFALYSRRRRHRHRFLVDRFTITRIYKLFMYNRKLLLAVSVACF